MQVFDMIINGQHVKAEATFDVINPASGQAFARVQAGNPAHVDQAVAAARAAFSAWSRTPDKRRQDLLHALGIAIEEDMANLMELVTKESGKPLGGLNGIGAGMEVGGAIAWTHVTADLSLPVEGNR
ncbi:aldehyde dehydrogenase family protein [Aromatoleum bremense]|uniref:aldehyde dehydrogenase family protein n=1 Tax=Aromatoleum bremense TaxID=76115 RepID=UPI001BB7A068|nr:aldehyde dehydrogenase family protein [Aromatoleum bremense]QTQ34139.1 putative aldehyde dehydrogenase [Aromatoleum bremense]